MLAASTVGILLIPMLYVFFQTLRERTGRKPKGKPMVHATAAE
jgi:HAE1 family hydrophobic/amphiphilic exporter-1